MKRFDNADPGRTPGRLTTLFVTGLLGAVLASPAAAMNRTECEAAAAKDGLTAGRAMDDYIRRCIGATEEKIDGTAVKRGSPERTEGKASDERTEGKATDRSESVKTEKGS